MDNKEKFLIFVPTFLYVMMSIVIIYSNTTKEDKQLTNVQCNHVDGIREVRVTGYIPTGNKTAIGEDVVVGRTAAISPACLELLGKTVYIHGHGVRYINDLTNPRADKKYDMCTVDLAVPTKKHAFSVGNNVSKLVQIDKR